MNVSSFPPEAWLTGPAMMAAGGEPFVTELLQQMTPERALVQLTAQELKPQARGPWHVAPGT